MIFFVDQEILVFCASLPIVYHNADSQKKDIYLNNKGKNGVYMWVNTVNGKRYVGSSVDLQRRFSSYYSVAYLTKYSTLAIHRALLKYGYSVFSLEILEYCEPEKLKSREQYYMDLYKPEYNILKFAGSSKGYFPTEEMKLKNLLSQPKRREVIVTDVETNISTPYNSICEAARALGIHETCIIRYFSRNQKKPYKKKYTFKLVEVEK